MPRSFRRTGFGVATHACPDCRPSPDRQATYVDASSDASGRECSHGEMKRPIDSKQRLTVEDVREVATVTLFASWGGFAWRAHKLIHGGVGPDPPRPGVVAVPPEDDSCAWGRC